jgi:hypothetical protein
MKMVQVENGIVGMFEDPTKQKIGKEQSISKQDHGKTQHLKFIAGKEITHHKYS